MDTNGIMNSKIKDSDIKISFIVAVFNIEVFVSECIESLIHQTYRNIEIILIDDGSTDNSGKICDQYASKDSRVRTIHQKNMGLSEARNTGMRNATGDYIGFVDGDDIVSLECARIAVETLKRSPCDILFWKYKQFIEAKQCYDNQTSVRDYRRVNPPKCLEELLLQNLNEEVWNGIYKKIIAVTEKFPAKKQNEDVFWKYRVILKANDIGFISDQLYFYRIRPGSITQSPFSWKRFDSLEGRYRRTKDIIENYPELKATALSEIYAEAMFLYSDVVSSLHGEERKLGLKRINYYLDKLPFRFSEILFNDKISKMRKVTLVLSKISFAATSRLKVFILKRLGRDVFGTH